MGKEITLNVKGMSCQMCVKHVTKALQGVDGVTEVVVNLDANNAKVAYDPAVAGIPQFAAAVAEAGYEVVD